MTRTRPGILTDCRDGGEHAQIVLDNQITTLGRSELCTVVIVAPSVSRLHARIELQYDRYVLCDAGSANGTFVNGKRIQDHHRLTSTDQIWLGSPDHALCFFDPEETHALPINTVAPQLYVDEYAHTVQVYGVPVSLSPLEYRMLVYLGEHAGTLCSREACFQAVWNQSYDPATCEDALNACVSKLRRNLRVAAEAVGRDAPPITTIQRGGFRLDAEVLFAPRVAAEQELKERVRGA